jgi:hypothetical protein
MTVDHMFLIKLDSPIATLILAYSYNDICWRQNAIVAGRAVTNLGRQYRIRRDGCR